MMVVLILMLVVGAGVSATNPRIPKENAVHSKPVKCGPNSHFERCSKICPPQNCSNLIDPLWLCENPRCKPECRCNDGYFRDDRTGICISRDECLAQCGPLERFVKDSRDCQRTCANYKVTPPHSLCKPFTGCVCKKGRVRLNDNATGACVLPKDCPSRQCPLHEHWEDCPSVCANETCISKNPDYKCLLPAIPLPCKPRCICNKGYLRNHLGYCIPEKHCPIKRCPINEVWRCASLCPRDSCKRLEPGFKCPPGIVSVCIPACACKDGYLRNDSGLCIPRELCPASLRCGINEVAVECQSYIPQTCESVYTFYKPIGIPPCIPGCDCRPGYLRNKQNICVPSEFCPTVPPNTCGVNQEYRECGTSCEPSCADLDNPRQLCPAVCIKGCFCKEGYLKDEHGNCVPKSQCPPPVCNKPNEVAKDCGSYCEIRTCEDYNRTDIVCPAVCVRGCFCRKGYVRNAYGVCIRPEKCPPKPVCLQENEEYQSCGSSCPDNCDNYINPNRICTSNCVAGCNCKKGYVRNLKDNTCVKPEQCPSKECTGQNERLNYCASYCPVTCANRLTQGDWACITLCREACDCIPGTLRNDSGVCVPVEQCTPPVCGQNEKYMQCGTACPLTCDNFKNPPPCTRQCVADCFCEDGYVRDRYMRCVKPENCEPICPTGEKFNECSAHCQDTCENYNVTNRICTYKCQSGCECEEGTVRRKDGQCVPPSKCIETISCPADEIYDPCSAHCEPTCEHHGPDRVCTAICKPGCKCGNGLVRRKDGKCVPLKECPGSQCPANEVYDPCPPINCPPGKACAQVCTPACRCADGLVRCKDGRCAKPENCETTPPCPPSEHYDECNCEPHGSNVTCLPCEAGCRCNDGLVRRKDGQCVPLQDCSAPLCSSGEVYDPCPPINCPPGHSCAQVCRPGCKCADGLIRCKDGRCATPKDCQTKPQCPVNERWVDCVIGLCIPLTCDQLGFPIACPGIIGPCKGGCVCAENYVRDYNNICIPKQDCPSCGNDFNATSGCGIHCGRQCTDYKEPHCDKPLPCQYNGCDCKQGYVYDIVTERCVASVDCPTPCNGDLYAEKVKCPNPCPATCAKPTTAICPRACLKKGCQCRPGFVLNPDGKCVRPETCPDNLGCNGDPNARISSCVSLCEPTCGRNDIFCPAYCGLGCACKNGFILSKPNGICIKPENCVNDTACAESPSNETPPLISTTDMHATVAEASASDQQATSVASSKLILCPNDEIWINCKAGYYKPQYCRDINKELACPQVTDPCPGGCICRDGLLRNEDNICIPKDQCLISKPCSDPNAIRKKCASHESCRATCAVPNSKVCPRICIINGCECKKGYVLSAKGGNCVKIEDCPHANVSCNGDPNAVIRAFPEPCPSTCELPNGIPGCLKLGPDVGCECKPGYLKADDNGKCILPNDCKGGNPCGANATFSSCRSYCPYEYCPEDDSRIITPCELPVPCPSGCVCELNHKRKSREDDRCIISSTCPPVKCTRPNEIWDPCPSECRRESCIDVNNQPTTCNTLVLNCQPQCICKKGYFRNNKDICIPAKDCPLNKPCEDPNAERVECAPAPSCRSTCATPNPSPCILSCAVNECVCKKGYVLSAKDGKCIPVDKCPNAPCNGDSNAVIKANPIPCPSTCNAPNASPWCKRYAPPIGCECKPGYLQAEHGGKCIKPEECPGGNPCGVNSTFVWCKAGCPTDYCPEDDSRAIIACDPPFPCPSGCVCKLNYRRKSVNDDRCIVASTCPPVNCTRPNEIWDPCPSACLRENCADVNNQPITCNTIVLNCQPRCVCKKGYFRNDTDICIPAKNCPCADLNAERVQCAPALQCRPTCAVRNPGPCIELCVVNDCICKKGYILSESGGKCIPESQCPAITKPCEDPNAERVECAPAPSCRSTCATPNPSPCILSCAVNECVCKKGYVLSAKDGKCIPVDKCPKDAPCNGDSNAVIKANPIPCPSTCSAPNANPWCKRYAPPIGCECKPGYLQAEDGGKCIKPEECPGGNPCGVNSTFVWCKVGCPTNYCPVDDRRAIIACSPPYPCPNGCVCKLNYRRKSVSDDRCILASTCPPVNCTRPNEIWDPCPSACLRENCADVNNQPTTCNTLVLNCQPRCVCKKGYFRNDTDICIPAKNCPCNDPNAERVQCAPALQCRPTCAVRNPGPCIKICVLNDCVCKKGYILSESGGKCIPESQCPANNQCSDPNAERVECAPAAECRPTCAVPNPGPCISQICIKNECVCKAGYVLSEKGGKCVNADQCPIQKSCNGDPNAQIKECPLPCPATCDAPNAIPCRKACVPVGCECKDGYILSETGKCILPEKCKGGNPCGRNETFVSCKVTCPWDYCPVGNSPNGDVCETPNPCYPGCVCKFNYRRKSVDDRRCIYASECPPQKCNKNEVWSRCPSECLQEDCSSVNDPPVVCNTLLLNCQPKCICKKGYYRNSDRNCVRASKCPKPLQCKANEVYRTCRFICPPQTCASTYSSYDCRNASKLCEPGCNCINDYLRNGTENDPCIPSSQCPPTPPVIPECGINEHYETNRTKCELTCTNYKLESVMGPCQATSGCFCNTGYVRNSSGLCIPKKKCPQNIVCPPNEVLSECYNTCHRTCKTRLRSDGRMCHLGCTDTGCLCKEGYLRHDNGTCVPINECSPPRCNENETYSSCGTACPPTCKNRGNNNTVCTDQCVEDCFCNKGLVRADDGVSCIKPKDCPPPVIPECGINEHYETNRTKYELNCTNYKHESVMGPCQATSGCFCDKGYVRNSNGICIPKEKCPQNIVCPPNEVLSECYNTCHRTCKTRLRSDGRMCHLGCTDTGCLCKEGYLRHDNGTCVPINECSPPRCNENETYSSCGTACPPTCKNRGDTCTVCTEQCVEDCFCNKGLVRADDGVSCINPKHCPKRTCKGPNELFDECPPTCPPTDGCSNIWSKFNCTGAIKCCKPHCRCRSPYFRNGQGICVPSNQC